MVRQTRSNEGEGVERVEELPGPAPRRPSPPQRPTQQRPPPATTLAPAATTPATATPATTRPQVSKTQMNGKCESVRPRVEWSKQRAVQRVVGARAKSLMAPLPGGLVGGMEYSPFQWVARGTPRKCLKSVFHKRC